MKALKRLKQSFQSMDLKKKLLVFSLSYVVILMSLVLVFYTTRTEQSVYERNLENVFYQVYLQSEALRTNIMLVEEISNQIYNNNPLNKGLMDQYRNPGDSAEITVDLLYPVINNNLFAKREIIDTISIYIENKTFLINEQEVRLATESVKAQDWYAEAMDGGGKGQILWSYEKDENGVYRLALTRNLNGYLGRSAGVLRISIKAGYLQSFAEQEDATLYTVLQRRGDSNMARSIMDERGDAAVHQCIEAVSSQAEGRYELVDGAEPLMAVYRSFGSGNSQYTWKTVALLPRSLLYDDSGGQRTSAIVIAILATIVEAAVIILFAGSFTRRIHDLDEKAKLVAQGNFDVRLDVGGMDEIGRLSVSINKMLDYIDHLIHEVYENQIKAQASQLKQNESEFRALQNQINPHFLYNTLDAMRYKATLAGNRELGAMMVSLSRLLSYTVNQKGSEVRLDEELDHLGNYLMLVKARFEDMVEYVIDVDGPLRKAIICKLTLQPIVENCIQHGMRSQRQALKITVTARRTADGQLVISVLDNGRGIDGDVLQKINSHVYAGQRQDKAHVGLDNVHNRIKLFFGGDYGVTVQSKPGLGTEVLIRLPFRED